MEAARAQRVRLPQFLTDVVGDRAGRPVLFAAFIALAAVGLDPPILEPAMPSMQSAIRSAPDLQSLLLVVAVWKAAAVLIGGVLADVFRSRRLLQLGLLGLVVGSIVGALVTTGPVFFLARLISTMSVGIVLPFVIGSVGTVYSGIPRATAIGLAYSGLGLAQAVAPVITLLNGPRGPFTPAFLLCAVVAVIALAANRRLLPPLPHAALSQRPLIVATALWAFGVTAIVASVINFRIDALDWLVTLLGLASIGTAFYVLRRRPAENRRRVNLRPVTVVLAVGIVIGFAQVVPLLKLPQFFTLIQGLSPLAASAAVAPFVVALLISGPLSGWLLARVGPRTLIAGGVIAVGIADVAIAAILVPSSGYLLFVVPYVLIGAGFVITTVVRTAIIFASVPKEMPGSAAALNEASLGLGSRLGTIFSTSIVTQIGIAIYSNSLGQISPAELEERLQPLRELLYAIGLPSFPELLDLVDPATRTAYAEAALAGVRVSLLIPGVLAIVTGLIAFLALGRRDPIKSVWDYADERGASPDTNGGPEQIPAA
jgi:DHA2 family multidrug resistance protein-like MFS transporter